MNPLEWFGHLSSAVQVALATGTLALPAVFLGHRLGMRKQGDDIEDKFTGRMLEALSQRDKTIETQGTQLQNFMSGQIAMSQALGEARAMIIALERNQTARDERERVYIAELAGLKLQLSHYEGCSGGSPCPFKRPQGVTHAS